MYYNNMMATTTSTEEHDIFQYHSNFQILSNGSKSTTTTSPNKQQQPLNSTDTTITTTNDTLSSLSTDNIPMAISPSLLSVEDSTTVYSTSCNDSSLMMDQQSSSSLVSSSIINSTISNNNNINNNINNNNNNNNNNNINGSIPLITLNQEQNGSDHDELIDVHSSSSPNQSPSHSTGTPTDEDSFTFSNLNCSNRSINIAITPTTSLNDLTVESSSDSLLLSDNYSLQYPQYYSNQTDPKNLLFQYCVEGKEDLFIELLKEQIESPNQTLGNSSLDANRVLTSQFIYHDFDKCTLFHLSSKFNRVNSMEKMLEYLPSILTFKDSKQANCLFYAVSNNSKEACALVCNYYSMINGLSDKKFTNELDMYGNCCLYLAMQKSFYELADLLLLFGANIDISFKTGETMLHRAITERRLDIVEYLSKKGANLLKQNQNNENPLFNVFVHQKKKETNVNTSQDSINSTGSNGGNNKTPTSLESPTHSAPLFSSNNSNFCRNGALFLQNLLKSNAFSSEIIMKGLKQKNSHGRTMFQECIVKGDLPSFKVLVAYLTTRENSEQTLSWFVNDVENQKQRTSLHLSVAYKQFHMCKILVDAIPGIAKLDTLDSDGKTAMDLARETNQENTIQFFNEIQQLQKEKKSSGFGFKKLFRRLKK
ncbi:predicted protein [Naegleria gruberi]|uniref:Predicted protein n=1 Tax=Naegleria gruberi TaxID=5762 RepID=D2V815_NAEGR|nr:uncharacterized protein NAEGRDRAFT_64993 [Naegleria gruberi]EFC46965.1 predicted protein [Naegleria gruberi]|eukprot:XP_002679709.1 predicted protein [Naegleria gruberi strain NEG-M]